MKNSRMAQQLRLLSLKPSLEAEGDVKAGITGLYDPNHPADNGGPKDEDKHLTAKIVEVDDGPKTEAAKTEVEDSVSQEGFGDALKWIVSKQHRMQKSVDSFDADMEKFNLLISEAKAKLKAAKESGNVKAQTAAQKEVELLEDDRDWNIKTNDYFKKQLELHRAKQEAKLKATGKPSNESLSAKVMALRASLEALEGELAGTGAPLVEAAPIVEPAPAVVVEPEVIAPETPVVEETVVETVPAVEPTPEEVEGEEAIDAYEEVIDEANEHAEEYEQAATSLESLIEALGEARQNGGLTPQSAKFFQIGFESIGVRLTGAPFKNAYGEDALPSLESFGGSMRRDAATQISLEAAESWYVKVWEVLKKTFAQIRDWVVKFAKALFDQSARYNQRADKIIEAAGKVGAAKAKSDKVTFGGARQIVTGSSVDAGSISKVLTVAQDAALRTGESFKAIDAVKKYLVDMASAGATDFATFSDAEAALQEGKLRSSLFSHEYKGEGENGFETDALPGNVKFRIAYQTHSSQARFKALMESLLGARVSKESAGEIPEDLSARTLNPSEISDLARKVKTVLKAADDSKKEFSVESLDIANVQVPQDDDAAKAKEKQKFINATVKAVSKASAGISQLLKYTIQTSGGYLDYANASLKQYGAAVESEAAAA